MDWDTTTPDQWPETSWAEPAEGHDNYSEQECVSALRGERLPEALDKCPWVTRLCVLRGIRYHHGFGTKLRDAGHLELVRALNARDIMSHIIPDMAEPSEIPYCIWHPEVASEETYRSLWKRYPEMRYNVGRACAVAGYAGLYQELDILPDISIAEEARDNRSRNSGGSQAIFDMIMCQPVKWCVMDDYTRHINIDNPTPARFGLNGDTAVYSSLELKRAFENPYTSSRFGRTVHRDSWMVGNEEYQQQQGIDHPTPYFNITEDWCIDEFESNTDDDPLPNSSAMIDLLWSPLLDDLPEGNKDVLILMAAYYGNIDRYDRLRRPNYKLLGEDNCVVRGIHHNTMFAKWWSLQSKQDEDGYYSKAVNARFIMSNDISRITRETPHYDLPYMIWYPDLASSATYMELARRKPEMVPAVARACIVADYQEAWDELDFEPSCSLIAEAEVSPNPHYLADLCRRCAKRGFEDIKNLKVSRQDQMIDFTANKLYQEPSTNLLPFLPIGDIPFDHMRMGFYNGWHAEVGMIELFACAPPSLRPSPDHFHSLNISQLYYEIGHRPPPGSRMSMAYHGRHHLMRRRGGSGIAWGNGQWE